MPQSLLSHQKSVSVLLQPPRDRGIVEAEEVDDHRPLVHTYLRCVAADVATDFLMRAAFGSGRSAPGGGIRAVPVLARPYR